MGENRLAQSRSSNGNNNGTRDGLVTAINLDVVIVIQTFGGGSCNIIGIAVLNGTITSLVQTLHDVISL